MIKEAWPAICLTGRMFAVGGLAILRSDRIERQRILIGSRFFVTLSPLIGQQTTNSRQNMT
jgi:hypothetical protein